MGDCGGGRCRGVEQNGAIVQLKASCWVHFDVPLRNMLGFYSSITLHYFMLAAGKNLQWSCKPCLRTDFHFLIVLNNLLYGNNNKIQHFAILIGMMLVVLHVLCCVARIVRVPILSTSRQAPTDLLCCKAFLMHVLNESQRIDGPGIITFSRGRLCRTK